MEPCVWVVGEGMSWGEARVEVLIDVRTSDLGGEGGSHHREGWSGYRAISP